jgi:hypothetical protein
MLRFKFIGGFLDGLDVSENSATLAERSYFRTAFNFTDGGTVGKGWDQTGSDLQALLASNLSPAEKVAKLQEINRHRYTATSRAQEGEDEIVTMTYSLKS